MGRQQATPQYGQATPPPLTVETYQTVAEAEAEAKLVAPTESEFLAIDVEADMAAQDETQKTEEVATAEPIKVEPTPAAVKPAPAEEIAEEEPVIVAPAPAVEPVPAPAEEIAEEEPVVVAPAPAVEPVPAPLPAANAPAQKLTGREIAQKMDRAHHVQDTTRVASMLIERKGEKLIRKMIMRAKRYGDDERSVIRFDAPADVRDTQYLSWVYEDPQKDDDLWVFFPSENMIRRISGGGKKGSFMRSDFANEDIEARAVDDDTHVLQEEAELDGKPVYVIESTPISIKMRDSSYSKRKIWVDKEIWLPLRVEFYDKRGKLLKTLLHGDIKEIDGVWTATKLIMETPRKKSRTLMQYHDITYNSGLGDDLFNQSTLKR